MAYRNGVAVPAGAVDTGRHAGKAEDLDDWAFERGPYRARHAAGVQYADQRGHDVAWMTAAERAALNAR